MSSSGSETTSTSPYSVDKAKLAEFAQTQVGQKFGPVYNPANSYLQVGQNILAYDPSKTPGGLGGPPLVGGPAILGKSNPNSDATSFISAYQAWLQGDTQTQQNWQSYANAVEANKGGQGDNTILTGAAVGQRQAILGTLANAGNSLTTPTPGLGVLGATVKKLGALR